MADSIGAVLVVTNHRTTGRICSKKKTTFFMIKSHTDKNLKVREVYFYFNTDFEKKWFPWRGKVEIKKISRSALKAFSKLKKWKKFTFLLSYNLLLHFKLRDAL